MRRKNPARTFSDSPSIAFVVLDRAPPTFALVDLHVLERGDWDAVGESVVGFMATAPVRRGRGTAYTYVDQVWAENGYGPMVVEGAAQWLADHGRVRLGPGDDVRPAALPMWKEFHRRGWSSGTYGDFKHRSGREKHLDKLYRPPRRVPGFADAEDRGRNLIPMLEGQVSLAEDEIVKVLHEAGDASFRAAIAKERAANPLGVGEGANFNLNYTKYKTAYEETYRQLTEHYGRMGRPLSTAASDVDTPPLTSAFDVFREGHYLVPIILATRAIPKEKVKAYQKAHKLFSSTRRPGGRKDYSGPTRWFAKNLASVQLLLESNNWPPLGETADVRIEVGPFVVINQSGQDPDTAIKTLQAAQEAIANSNVPRASELLYGDVYVVGDVLRKRKVMAQYYPGTDTVQLIYVSRFEASFVRSLIHELGHRYWRKGMAPGRAWIAHHTRILQSARPSLPPIGSMFKIRGEPVQVLGYTDTKIKITGNRVVGIKAYLNAMKHQALADQWPTPYSATSAEEHFCEAFSLYCLGELKEPHQANFEALVVHRGASPEQQRQRNMARRICNP